MDDKFVGSDSQVHTADIYELALPYVGKNTGRGAECLNLGPPTLEVVALRIETDSEYHFDSVKYRIRLRYLNAPSWMRDDVLIGKWRELRESVRGGMACDGEHGFDRETRELAGGNGGCWWAYH
jgi:hypothetical protein